MSKCVECNGNIPYPGVICEDCYTQGLEDNLRGLGGRPSDLYKTGELVRLDKA